MFRAKTYGDKWITGSHVYIQYDTSIDVEDFQGSLYITAGHYIIQEVNKAFTFIKVIPESLGMATGLPDTGDVEMYAGFEYEEGKFSRGDIVDFANTINKAATLHYNRADT